MTDTKPFDWGLRLPTLKTPRLTLRALAEPDVADVFAVFSDPVVMRYWDSAAMTTFQDAMKDIDHIHRGFRRRELFQWGIAETATDAVLGTCTLTHYSPTMSDRRSALRCGRSDGVRVSDQKRSRR